MTVYRTLALKLHAYGLNLLNDPNWTGMDLYDKFKRFYRGQAEPRDLFLKPIKNGFLYQLGLWLFEKYLQDTDYRENLGGEYLIWYAEEFLEFLNIHNAKLNPSDATKLQLIIDKVGDLYDADEDAYFRLLESYRHRSEILTLIDKLVQSNFAVVSSAAPDYADNYTERVFHDRELCEFISHLLVTIGFDGTSKEEPPQKWVERPNPTAWLSRAVIARERGKCANCRASITDELEAKPHLDHIVPLSKGGCSDMVNYQLLCADCNLRKSSQNLPVNASIPGYLQKEGANRPVSNNRMQ